MEYVGGKYSDVLGTSLLQALRIHLLAEDAREDGEYDVAEDYMEELEETGHRDTLRGFSGQGRIERLLFPLLSDGRRRADDYDEFGGFVEKVLEEVASGSMEFAHVSKRCSTDFYIGKAIDALEEEEVNRIIVRVTWPSIHKAEELVAACDRAGYDTRELFDEDGYWSPEGDKEFDQKWYLIDANPDETLDDFL